MRIGHASIVIIILLMPSLALADIIIGPGNIDGDWKDSAFNIIAVDLNFPATFGPGNFVATQFNYQFNSTVVGAPSAVLTGTITPLLLTGSGTSYTPIAIGDTITYSGPTSFISVPFGGSNSFTLGSSTTVYPGLYWTATEIGQDERMPVGYDNFTGNSYVFFGGGTGAGANTPVVGTPVSATGQGPFQRTYDFSVTVAAVPEPSSLILSALTIGLVGGACLQRRWSKDNNLPHTASLHF